MKIEINIEFPEGYELAKGNQPRIPNIYDEFCRMDGVLCRCANHQTVEEVIILKKKAPYYQTTSIFETDMQFVEIKALKDALSLVTYKDLEAYGLDVSIYEALKELIK